MLKLEKVNKYFNRYHKNQIHVIDDTNIAFNSANLVAILGPSGCGKTTLLNVIGGLDKVSSGKIYINGERITNRKIKKIDEIRNLNIGYIFQDYKLIDNISVFDNVALALKLIGVKDQKEIEKRVIYTLKAVNMERYKNRPANMLSGGEKQRVGIARALVKNPKIILADEPTGNLDSKNSLEIMHIIKKLSKKYLVILVTHEEELASYYADKIIELKDGHIEKVYDNSISKQLNYKIDSHIYLKDYKYIDNLHKDNLNISIYRENPDDLDIKIVFKNGSIYIENNNGHKMEVIDNNSSIHLILDHYKEAPDIKDINFDIASISNNTKLKYSSILKINTFIKYGIKKLFDYPLLKKILLGGFFLAGMFIFYSVSSILATLNIEDSYFINVNKNYLNLSTPKSNIANYLEYEQLDHIDYILPGNSIVNFRIDYDNYLQTFGSYGIISGSLSNVNELHKDDLLYGHLPNKPNEIVIDKMTLERFMQNNDSESAAFFTIKDFLNHSLKLYNMKDFIIVGISNKEEPNIYAFQETFINILANSYQEEYDKSYPKYIDYNLVKDDIKLEEGHYPINDYEIVLNSYLKNEYKLNSYFKEKINNHKIKVVGFYNSITNNLELENNYLVNSNMIKYNLISKNKEISILSNNINQTKNYFINQKMNIKSSYDYDKKIYLNDQKDSILSNLSIALFILAISLIEILLMIRSSFLSRIKEVGIYRAIGVKKQDIYKMFMGEIIVITTIFSVTGISLMSYILYCLSHIELIKSVFMVNIYTYLISIGIVYIFNIIIGLLPVYNVLRKMPAEILARKDID